VWKRGTPESATAEKVREERPPEHATAEVV
jgi:hypothetical protein